ncbi:hypothetical protein [Pedomonas mirosovicensis]|uniref:hypothetical protein n=1 Tax=Pedomonas mirosovicensis TaxID=2908641 RepID=UPI00216736C6|nr:hypothetical protein [Pedomonas mirosovicensis]MCH8683765.1 hypothetical protein [Pedomonas mirosovicensis]
MDTFVKSSQAMTRPRPENGTHAARIAVPRDTNRTAVRAMTLRVIWMAGRIRKALYWQPPAKQRNRAAVTRPENFRGCIGSRLHMGANGHKVKEHRHKSRIGRTGQNRAGAGPHPLGAAYSSIDLRALRRH